MGKRYGVLVSIILLLFFSVGNVFAAPKIPKAPEPARFVNDFAGMLEQGTIQEMEKTALALKKASGTDLVVVTVDALEGYPIEDYSLELFRQWGLGDKDKNNGVLLLINKENALAGRSGRVRIEVGYGLEGAIPDGKAGRILDDYVLPSWVDEEFGDGIYHGFMALAATVAQEYNIDLSSQENLAALEAYGGKDTGFPLSTLITILVIFLIIRSMSSRHVRRRPRNSFPFDGGRWRSGPPPGGFGGFGGGGGFGGFGGGSGGGGGASR